jgi:predicted metalloprotease with PDZ domain
MLVSLVRNAARRPFRNEEVPMLKKLAAAVTTMMVLGATMAFAGGAGCSGAASASAYSCSEHSSATAAAWCGAWLERTSSGAVTVADVAPRSAAAKAGLRSGDIVTAVNGHRLDSGTCDKGSCTVGSSVTYTVQRGHSTRTVKFQLQRMPQDATQRYAHREASFDRTLAAVVMPAAH